MQLLFLLHSTRVVSELSFSTVGHILLCPMNWSGGSFKTYPCLGHSPRDPTAIWPGPKRFQSTQGSREVQPGLRRALWGCLGNPLYCLCTGSSLLSGSPWLMLSHFVPWWRCNILSNSFSGEDTGKTSVFRSFCVGANFISRPLCLT